jgi:hypothetical protein
VCPIITHIIEITLKPLMNFKLYERFFSFLSEVSKSFSLFLFIEKQRITLKNMFLFLEYFILMKISIKVDIVVVNTNVETIINATKCQLFNFLESSFSVTQSSTFEFRLNGEKTEIN